LEDGLRKLDDGPFNQYIPDLDWNSLDVNFTLPFTCRHLISPNYRLREESQSPEHHGSEILNRVLELLEVSANDFDVIQPLTIYGLDSLSAAKLSSILRPYVSMSQMQLLGGATWSEIQQKLQHSIPPNYQGENVPLNDAPATDILLDILGVVAADFSPEIPLRSYGLDSLGASRLATALQPFLPVTQMQLMGQATWAELLELGRLPRDSYTGSASKPLVEICGGTGPPLIVLPGGNGSASPFWGLRKNFHGPLWAIQITESTPLESLSALVGFWMDRILEKRPRGPYSLAAYSASTLPAVALTKLMEDAGEVVIQLTFVDHCPALWARPDAEALLREKTVEEFENLTEASVLEMLRNDPATGPAEFQSPQDVRGSPAVPPDSRFQVETRRAMMALIFEFLRQFYPVGSEKSYGTFISPFESWLYSVKAPLVLVIAEHGILHSAPGGAWPDLGASRFPRPVKVHYIRGVGHFGIFRNETVASILEGC
jgi:aryl carrier-like protein